MNDKASIIRLLHALSTIKKPQKAGRMSEMVPSKTKSASELRSQLRPLRETTPTFRLLRTKHLQPRSHTNLPQP